MKNACKVSINGNEYYVPCDYVDDLIVVNGGLVNVRSSTIYLYSNFLNYGDSYSGYPRITCQSNQYCYIRQSANSNISNLSVNNYSIVERNISQNILLSIVIVGVLICQLFKR